MITDNLLKIYASSFRQNWELPAITDFGSGATMTYADLARRIAATHLLFKECGVKRGDKIALMGRNSISWVETYMATITYGAVIVPVLHDFNVQDAMHIINHSESVMLFTNESIFDNMEFEKIPAIKAVLSLDKREVLAEHPTNNHVVKKFLVKLPDRMRKAYPHGFTSADVEYPELDENSLAEINYTSGTTGFSKGVMLTLRNLGGNVRFGIESRLHYRGSRNVSFLPLAHAYGCAFDMLTPLATGSHITLLGKLPTPKLLLKAFSQVKPHLIICVPLILEKIYRNKLRPILEKASVRNMLKVPGVNKIIYRKIRNQLIEAFGGEFEEVIVGGAPLNHEVEEFLHRIGFPFTVGYGMTECGPLISYTPWRKFITGSSGRTLPFIMESKIADSKDPANTPGEICVRGENVMVGYYKNPDATEAVLDAEESTVNVDEMHFTNVIFNLLDNAVKYRREEEPLRLTVSTRNVSQHGDERIAVTIRDNGIGMKREDLKKIFEKFYRVSTGNRHDVKGFGLGLAYVKKMVGELGGEISVESELNVGTKFTITLPITKN